MSNHIQALEELAQLMEKHEMVINLNSNVFGNHWLSIDCDLKRYELEENQVIFEPSLIRELIADQKRGKQDVDN